jgi:hypothetical protein
MYHNLIINAINAKSRFLYVKKIKLRNPIARSPLLRKGGVHSTPKRQKIQKLRVRDAILEWEQDKKFCQCRKNDRSIIDHSHALRGNDHY